MNAAGSSPPARARRRVWIAAVEMGDCIKECFESCFAIFHAMRNVAVDCLVVSMKLSVGQASRLPSRRSRLQKCLRARAGALAGQVGRLPYIGPGPVHGYSALPNEKGC